MSIAPNNFEGGSALMTPYTRELGGGANIADMQGGAKNKRRSRKSTKKMRKSYKQKGRKTGYKAPKNKTKNNKTMKNYVKKTKNVLTDIFKQMKKTVHMK